MTGATSRPAGWWYPYALCATAAAFAGLVYTGVLSNPFVYDDRLTVVGNPSIRDLGRPLAILMQDIFRPVVNLSYAIDFARSGLDPAGYHLTNIVLHMTNVVLLFFVVTQLVRDKEARKAADTDTSASCLAAAFAAASIFAVHPVMTEAVGYVSGRSELLCTTFFLAAFLALRSYLVGGRPQWLVTGITAFVLGLGAKETAAVLPFALIAYDFFILGDTKGKQRRRFLRFHLPFAGFVTIAGLIRVGVYLGVEQGSQAVGLWHNALTEVGVVWRYLILLVAPFSQSIMHPVETVTRVTEPEALLAILGLLAAAALLWALRRRFPLVVLGWVWFFLLLAPAHVIPLQEAMAEHRVYTASCGFFLAIGAGTAMLFSWLQSRSRSPLRIMGLVLIPLLAGLSYLTVARNQIWQDPVTLWADAAAKAPATWGAHYAHGDALRSADRCADAVAAYRRAIELIPTQVSAHLNLGICLAELGRFDEAMLTFRTAQGLDPSNPQPHNNLGTLAARTGQLEAARAHFLEAIRLDSRNIRARLLLAQMNETVFNNPARALELCSEVLTIEPRTSGAAECIERNQSKQR